MEGGRRVVLRLSIECPSCVGVGVGTGGVLGKKYPGAQRRNAVRDLST